MKWQRSAKYEQVFFAGYKPSSLTLAGGRRNGRYSGFPALGVKWQRMESAALRASHRLGPGQKGVLVRSVAPTSPAAGTLRAGDIIMRFDGMQVACDGTVPFRRAPSPAVLV